LNHGLLFLVLRTQGINMKSGLSYYFIILSVLLLCRSEVSAQDSSVRGLIIESKGASKISGVTILNKPTGVKTQTNELGLFTIQASKGDTLLISKAGFTEQRVVLYNLSDLLIRLQGIIQLQEVRVEAQTKKQELQEVRDQYRKKGSYFAGKPPLLSYIFMPLTAIYELVGKTPGQARRFNSFYHRELQQTEIDRRFNAPFVERISGLDSDDLKNFMILYRPDYEKFQYWDEYALIRYIKTSTESFVQAGRPKAVLGLPPLPKAPDLSEKKLKY